MIRSITAALLLLPPAALADKATEGCAAAQLGVAQQILEGARTAARRGERRLAARLAWQASLDARLAWVMTEREALRAHAWAINWDAYVLGVRLAEGR